jgi:subtilisin family serine protease
LSFGGPGRAKDYRENDPTKVEARTFPTAKVIGGYDFAGSDYTGNNVPLADGDPLDEVSHGTHVAGIAAGTSASGAVHSGVAPEASLIALKVFGRQGGTELATDAIEWCIESNLGRRVPGLPARCDVINMSLGSSWASDVTSELGVMQRAVEGAGIVVVASAGNSGDIPFVTGSPAATSHALSVASTHAAGETADKIQALHDGTTEDIEAVEASPELTPQLAEVGGVRAELAYFGRGCDNDRSANAIQEKVALIEWGFCGSIEKVVNASEGGAAAALVYYDEDRAYPMGVDAEERSQVPAYMIGHGDGQRLRQLLEQGKTVEILMSSAFKGAIAKDSLGDVISEFSSRGPSRNGEFKPNLSAPGSNIDAPRMGSGDQAIAFSGTSMASPIVAGVTALLVERLRAGGLAPPDKPLSPATGLGAVEVAAMLVNTATSTVWSASNRSGQPVPLARGGAGRVNAWQATRSETVLTSGTIASVNFGLEAFTEHTSKKAEFQIRNLGREPKRYRIETAFLMPADAGSGVSFAPSKTEMTVAPGQKAGASLYADADPAAMRRYPAYGGGRTLNVDALTDAELDAFLVATEVDETGQPVPDGDVARLPIYFLPRAASRIAVQPNPLIVDPASGHGPAAVGNSGGGWGRAELFALLAEEELERTIDPRLNIDQVGVRVSRAGRGDRLIEFVIHTGRGRTMPLESQAWVFIDVNRDGRMDWAVTNDYLMSLYFGPQRNILRQVVKNQPLTLTNTTYFQNGAAEFADVNLGSRTIILRVNGAAIGLSGDGPVGFDVVVLHQPNFPDVAGSARNDPLDQVPDDSFTTDDEGNTLIRDGADYRLSFDERQLGFSLSQWSLELEPGETKTLTAGRQNRGQETRHNAILAAFPMNRAQPGDTQLLHLEDGEVTVPTATPGVATPEPTSRPGPTDTPRPTGAPPTTTVGAPTSTVRIYLPLSMRAHQL